MATSELTIEPVPTTSAGETVPPAPLPTSGGGSSSYSQILKSSSIIGGSQAITILIGMVRTKGVALLLGPAGVGEVGLLTTATQLVGTFSGLGVNASGVREVAEAAGTGDQQRLSRTIVVLRRICWLTGIAGCILAAIFAAPLSQWTFGDKSRTVSLAILGVTILLGQVAMGQGAILQGIRRIGDLAKYLVIGAMLTTVASLSLYGMFGERGIVPALVATGTINLVIAWWFAQRVPCEPVSLTWRETWIHGRQLVTLGLAFMYSGLVMAATPWAIQTILARQYGTTGNGIYNAASALSAQFAGLVLGAMGVDFFPRLTAVAADHEKVNRLVNEQTEIGILLALPGLLATLAFAPWVVYIFYSSEFLPAAKLLPWFVLGVFGRVLSWPMGFIQLALGKSRTFAVTETLSGVCHVGLVALLTALGGIEGASWAFALVYAAYICLMIAVAGWLTGFRWSAEVRRLLWQSVFFIGLSLLGMRLLPEVWGTILSALLMLVAGVVCLRGLAFRLGPMHRVTRLLSRVPFLTGTGY